MIERAEAYDVGGEKVPVLVGKQGTAAGDVAKYLALYRGGTTVLLTFNVFDSEHLSPGAVEAVMRSVRLSAPLTLQQQVDALPFAFEVAPPFRLSGVLGGSAVLLTTFEGTDPSGTKPAIIIARSLSPVAPTPAAEEVNERLLQSTRGFEGAEVLVRQAAQFGGGAASYLEARSGTRKLLHYVRVAPDGMYLRLAAFGDGDALAGVSAAVAAIAASVAPR
ncbi:MAG: hypothetical protein H6983_16415 [Ectothiorhodospiraceae bacterium]|nr:hypothetical protein [Ectothiorhodospiraceae bacterium]